MSKFISRINTSKSSKGFSLVELMAVVGIIGALAAIAMSNYETMVIRAKRTEADMMLKTASTLFEAYWMNKPLLGLPSAEVTAFRSKCQGIGPIDTLAARQCRLVDHAATSLTSVDGCKNSVFPIGPVMRGDCKRLNYGAYLIIDTNATVGYAFAAYSTINVCKDPSPTAIDRVRLCKNTRCLHTDMTTVGCGSGIAPATNAECDASVCLTPFGQ